MRRRSERRPPQLLALPTRAAQERNQDLRPWDAGPVALVVIDLQPLFNDANSHWGGEAANAT